MGRVRNRSRAARPTEGQAKYLVNVEEAETAYPCERSVNVVSDDADLTLCTSNSPLDGVAPRTAAALSDTLVNGALRLAHLACG